MTWISAEEVLREPDKVYLVMQDDSRADPCAFPYSTPERAIEAAKLLAEMNYVEGGPPIEERYDLAPFLYYARYSVEGHSVEGHSVWVVERTMDSEI